MKKKSKMVKYWLILILIFIIGLIGFLSPYGDEKWNFLFENMILLPINLILTIFAINKVLELVESERSTRRFARITKKANEHLIKIIKKNVVSIPINCQVYDASRDEIELFNEVTKSPKVFFKNELFQNNRTYQFLDGEKCYNYLGIRMIHCNIIDVEVKKYMERYELLFDENLFNQLAIFEQENFSFGILNYQTDQGKIGPLSGDLAYMQSEALKYLAEAKKLIDLLESYETR